MGSGGGECYAMLWKPLIRVVLGGELSRARTVRCRLSVRGLCLSGLRAELSLRGQIPRTVAVLLLCFPPPIDVISETASTAFIARDCCDVPRSHHSFESRDVYKEEKEVNRTVMGDAAHCPIGGDGSVPHELRESWSSFG